jgi:hypothetical protein
MMQEYIFPSDPSVARRLVQLSRVTQTRITVEIEALATRGLLAPEDFAGAPSLTETQQKAVQKLIDYRLRGVLLGDSDDGGRSAILMACRLQGVRPILVCTRRASQWAQSAELFGLTWGSDPLVDTDVLILKASDILRQDVVRDRRNGVLVIEHTDKSDFVQGTENNDQAITREFARVIVLANFGSLTRTFHSWTRQCDIALGVALTYLWPGEILKILNQTHARVIDLKSRGFTKYRPADLYFMFNVIPDLLGERGPR